MRRVAITGIGAVSPLGNTVSAMISGIERRECATEYIPDWQRYKGLRCLVAAPVQMQDEKLIPRHNRRSMGRLSIFSVQATDQALLDSGIDRRHLSGGRLGCVIGSTMGSAESIAEAFETLIPNNDLSQMTSTKFFQCISHTAAMNVAQYLGITGRVMATCAACASAIQAIGAGYDLVRMGEQDIMLCGGAEGLHPTVVGSFDILFATSTGYNQTPKKTPRPFDAKRDGLVCGEGGGMVVLEEYESAKARKAHIYAEIIGYNTCGNGSHVSESNREAIVFCMQEALKSAGITPDQVDYINAHATATIQGDKEEAAAVREVFGDHVPISSLKGYMGHTLGASGAIELIASLIMMRKNVIYPTLNLDEPDAACQGIFHVTQPMDKKIDVILKNCFAFGGINSALVCRRAD
ncbi:MAG TPA: beta-ketoacyl synthase N-terminal-like domain-containing protein [Candidatus Hydrogenedentes bacterium]|nr:beta-ketoacyl synthase N-terminal-like domain-containing protein [Candidatus Hydrogenedentota bacterium]